MYVIINEKLNKMKDIVSKDIKETSTVNRTYRDVFVNGERMTSKKRVIIAPSGAFLPLRTYIDT